MLDMTFPEFEAAVARTDVVLLPIGSVEEHGPHLPLASDSIHATAFLVDVQRSLRDRGIETIVGPPLNIGITNEASDWSRDGTYIYPGSLTIRFDTMVALYRDVLQSLRDNGLRRAFLWSGHSGARQLTAVARIAEEASATVEGLEVWAIIASENVERVGLGSNSRVLHVERLRNFELSTELLGSGTEAPASTHADGVETSIMLHWQPALVRAGYERLPQVPSSQFFAASRNGDRARNPTGTGGFPFARASQAVGKAIADDRIRRVSEGIAEVLGRRGDSIR
jgi:creatinine amidohydrolase/Fe(II)-dependent formamide hydrolase-like protein